MLTVWCVWWRDPADPNKYSAYHVERLQRAVAENLTVPHQFVCMSSHAVKGVHTVSPRSGLPGWWGKLELFNHHDTGFCLYLDLDVVITGRLDDIIRPLIKHDLIMPLNWAASGHGGCQSSVMAWRNCDMTRRIFEEFDSADAHWPPVNKPGVLWGDQEWITRLRDTGQIAVKPLPEAWVKSYKYHCRDGLPDDCRVVVFHGQPKPETVRESWFRW